MADLRIRNLTHSYDNSPVLEHIDLSVSQGEFTCLAGPSGCGKTTLLRLIAGLMPVQKGDIRLDGKLIADGGASLPPEQRGIGFVFQEPALFPHMTVAENIAFGLHKQPASERKTRVSELLDQVQLTPLASHYPHQLSGGQQQRVALARALAPQPRLLLLDEPFTNLDRDLRRRIRDETLVLLKMLNMTAIMVTHEPYEAMVMSDRIILLNDEGRVHQQGAPDVLYHQPKDSFSALFFGDTNHFDIAVSGSLAETPFGVLPVDVDFQGRGIMLVRPEHFYVLENGEEGVEATIERSKCVGAECDVHLRLEDGQHVLVRPRGQYHGEVGETLVIAPDPAHLYIFPA